MVTSIQGDSNKNSQLQYQIQQLDNECAMLEQSINKHQMQREQLQKQNEYEYVKSKDLAHIENEVKMK